MYSLNIRYGWLSHSEHASVEMWDVKSLDVDLQWNRANVGVEVEKRVGCGS